MGAPLRNFGGLAIEALIDITHNNPLLLIKNRNNGTLSGANIKLENDLGQFVQLGIGSSQNKLVDSRGSTGGLGYSGGSSFGFTNIGNASWLWKFVDLSSFPVITQKKIMELFPDGSLKLYTGNLSVNGSINATQNISASYFIGDGSQLSNLSGSKVYTHLSNFTNDMNFINSSQAQVYNDTLLIASINTTLENNKVPYTNAINNLNLGNLNVTAKNGFFSYLGSSANRITGLFAVDINASEGVQAGAYYSSDGSQGMTNTTGLWACVDIKCKITCQLQIKNGLITGCV